MSRVKECEMTFDDIIRAGDDYVKSLKSAAKSAEKLLGAVKELKSMFLSAESNTAEVTEEVKPQEEIPEQPVKEETKPAESVKAYSFTEVRQAFSQKSREGFTDRVKELITKYGASKLSEIKESDYPALMADLEEIT
ncbi:MAG: hypothetical protein Q4C42_11585 [Clostridia bacterium]|nr:hypothetical protein [Clostridia bacterium]